MIGKRAELVMNRAISHAVSYSHEYFTLEHVLWSLLEESDVAEAVRACGGDPIGLRADLETYLKREIPHMKEAGAALQEAQKAGSVKSSSPQKSRNIKSLYQRDSGQS